MELIQKCRNLMHRLADMKRGPILLSLRLILGSIFISSGWGKLHNLDRVIGYFQSLGIPAASIQAPMVGTIEFVGGLFLLFGVFTRLAAIPLAATMVVAILTAKWDDVRQAFSSGGFLDGWLAFAGFQEVDYLVMLVVLFTFGAGAWSVDRLLMCRYGTRLGSTGAPPRT